MIQRAQYLKRLIASKDLKMIKVITGVRRCGKSTLLMQYHQYLLAHGVDASQCITINFENIDTEPLQEYHALYDAITSRLVPDKMNYIMLDEIQMVPAFQKAIDSLFLRDNVDIYLTGSNAYMLSGELSTLLSGRYVEIRMLPFSFKEFYEVEGGDRQQAFQKYFWKGGLPYGTAIGDENTWEEYMNGIYNTVVVKDIMMRHHISDPSLIEMVVRFLADNVGNMVSAQKIANTLTSNGRKTTADTIHKYLRCLKEAFFIYEAPRYDIKGKQYLKQLGKYYLADPGFRTAAIGRRTADIGHVLENIVYLELIRRGFDVYVGKWDKLEVDFVAKKGEDTIYYQVSASVLDPRTYEREFNPLRRIHDNYPKIVLTMDQLPMGDNGIEQVNVIDFLMQA